MRPDCSKHVSVGYHDAMALGGLVLDLMFTLISRVVLAF